MDRGSEQPRRLLELDALRGIASVLVLLYHFNYKYVRYNPNHGELPLLFGWGHHGVELFFAISGFVISMTLDRMDGVVHFARARFSRLFPVYWASMAITSAVIVIGGATKLMVSPGEALVNVTMVQYWFDITSIDGSYWSLSIELSFYCVMALVLHMRQLHRMEVVLAVWLLFHIGQVTTGILPVWTSRMLALDYIPLFAIGLIHYRFYSGTMNATKTFVWQIALIAIIGYSGVSAAIVAVGTIALFWAVTNGWMRFLVHPLLLWLGAISYPLYLIHQYVGYVLIYHMEAWGLSLLTATVIALGAVLLLAHALHIWVESPAQRHLRVVRRKPSLVTE